MPGGREGTVVLYLYLYIPLRPRGGDLRERAKAPGIGTLAKSRGSFRNE